MIIIKNISALLDFDVIGGLDYFFHNEVYAYS